MKKILLIKVAEPIKQTHKDCVVPPIGLWSIRSNLEQICGVKVDLCDMHLDNKDIEDFLSNEYDIVGISCQFTTQHDEYARIAKLVKKRMPNTFLVAGGFHAGTVEPPEGVDLTCKGAGENFFLKLFEAKPRAMEDLFHPTFSKKELNDYVSIDRPHNLVNKTGKWVTIETSRGCVRKCGFCGAMNFWGNINSFSVEWLDNYFNYLVNIHGVKEVIIEDDNFAWEQDRFVKILELFKKYNLAWSVPNGIEVDTIVNHVDKLKASGCWQLYLPFETGTQRVARLMKIGTKWKTFEEAKEILDIVHNEDIKVCGFFVIGYPGETKEEIQATFDYGNALPFDDRHFHIATPYPGTEIYDICKEKGYFAFDNEEDLYRNLLHSKSCITTEDFTNDEVDEMRNIDRQKAIERRSKK
jgi:anaerobic magnesium-protoporphyrin IX monomethyl ester cyclase